MDILYLIAAMAGLLALQSLLLGRRALRNVTYTRTFSKKAAFAGDTVEMVEVLRNRKLRPVPWLRAESRMSSALLPLARAQDEGTHETTDDALFHRSVFYLAPYSQVTRRHTMRLLRRGQYAVGSVALTAGDLLGLSQQAQSHQTGAAITVWPRPLDEAEIDWPSSRWQGDLVVRRWVNPDPFLVGGIREYQRGDARRDIHWAATARTGALQVKAHDYTANPRLLVVLNVQMQERQWNDLMDYEQQVIEKGISLAATLCLRALSGGVEAGFAANAPLHPQGKQPTLLLPLRYAGRDEELLDALARLHILRVRSFHTFLEELGPLTGMDIVILSAYDSPMLQERMSMLRLRGNTVTLWPLRPETEASA